MKLALGTVQFGTAYGAFNDEGAVPEETAAACLDLAEATGITLLDTARGYGNSETMLGRLDAAARFRIVTKTPALHGEGAVQLASALDDSLAALRSDRVYGLMLHRAQDLLGDDADAVWGALALEKERGRVEKVGVSVYSPDQAVRIVQRYPIDLVQAPFSAFDQRLRTSGALDLLASRDVEVHVRSIFLQGFALADPDRLPAHLARHRAHLLRFRAECARLGVSPIRLALAAAEREPRIARIVVGVQSLENLREIIDAAGQPAPEADLSGLATDEIALINPSLWTSAS